jgi:CubicO group peptidase (beta-lactamase class C family)
MLWNRTLLSVLLSTSLWPLPSLASDCEPAVSQQSELRAKVAAKEYSEQIQLARQAALGIYEHGLPRATGSSIPQQIGRPPGLSVAVAVNGKLVWAEGFGFADLEQCVPVLPNTKFRIGSVSKPLTAVAAALLYQEGKLILDAPIQRYVPAFPDKGYVITTRQLLGHLGGIRHYNSKENTENQQPYHSVTEALARFKDDPLVAPPGIKFSYSSYGYNLISAAIESASGEDFLDFMHDRVFVPLGMLDTVADENEKIIEFRARWYQINADGSYRNSPYSDLSYKWASGGFLSTAEDLVRFGSSLLAPGFLRESTLKEMFTPQQTSDGKGTQYGLGWFIHTGVEHIYEHDGGSTGSSSWLILYPDQHVVIAWLMNNDDLRSNDQTLREVAAPFLTDSGGS